MFNFIPIQYRLAAKILVILVVLVAGYSAGWAQRGTKAENEMLTLRNQQQAAIVQYQKEVAQTKQTLQGFANKVEEQGNEYKQKRDAELFDFRKSGGLFDNGKTVSTTGTNPATGSTPGATATPSGARLSNELAEFLGAEANKADRVADQDKLCLDYIKKLTELQKQKEEKDE